MAFAFYGDMTFYTPGLGSCGAYSGLNDTIVAISAAKMNSGGNPSNNPLCFTHITITNSAGHSEDATIVDTCPGCAEEGIDVTEDLFGRLADVNKGRVKVSWTGTAFH